MNILYGIPNCDTVKKARRWLDERHIDYRFHDFRKDGLDAALLREWIKHFGWEQVINRRGTTWKQLDDAQRNSMNPDSAAQAACAQPALIKRPVLMTGKDTLIGFDETQYTSLFRQHTL